MRLPKTKPLFVDLPQEVVRLLGPSTSEAAAELKRLALIELYRRGEISTGYAAEVLEITRLAFIQLLDQHEIAISDATPEELAHEIEVARTFLKPSDPHSSDAPPR